MDPAPVLALLAGAAGVACTLPYLRDTLRRTTVPHRGSWLIWSVLEVVALEAQRADGARWSLIPLLTQASGTCLVLALSVRLGTGRLTRVDLALVALAGFGVAGWLMVDVPLIATICVIVADFVAVLMMLPKTWRDPHTETLSMFVLAGVGGFLTIGAVGTMSMSLLAYPVYFAVVNVGVAVVIHHRRRTLGPRSEVHRVDARYPCPMCATPREHTLGEPVGPPGPTHLHEGSTPCPHVASSLRS